MTTGDQGAPKSSAARAATRSPSPKKKAAATGTKQEPRVTAASPGSVAKRMPRPNGAKREAEVLERLNRLGDPAPATVPSDEPLQLPAIVEADPSYPPMPAPSAVALDEADQGGAPSPDAGNSSVAVAERPAEAAAAGATDLDEPTALIEAPPFEPPTFAPTDVVPLVALDTAMLAATDDAVGVALPDRPLQRPVAFRRARPRVRRVTRVVRHVDTWSVFKVAVVFNTVLYTVCLTAGVLLWNVAYATGTIDNVEKFFEQFGWSSFQFKGGEIYHNAWIAGLFVAIGLTGFAVLLATLFNLITDLVGGIRVSVLEEEVVARTPSRRNDLTLSDAPLLDPTEPG